MNDQLQPTLQYIKLWMQFFIDHPEKQVTRDFLEEWIAFCQSKDAEVETLETAVALYHSDAERIWALMPELRGTDSHYEIHEAVYEKIEQGNRKLAEQQAIIESLLTATCISKEAFLELYKTSGKSELTALLAKAREEERAKCKVRYMRPNSHKWDSPLWAAFGAMADECRSSKLYPHGDAILVWVNEGDIVNFGELLPSEH